jgi:diadenosine tetraphosphate (Ap4A) HIT family hydrolase
MVEFDRDPVLSALTSRRAVLQAIDEFDRLGRDAFLAKYGYGPARRYFLEHDGRHYDSKAIVGVAHGHQYPNRGPLANTEFSGGHQTVQKKLEELGFLVLVLDPEEAVAGPCPFCSPDPERVFHEGDKAFAMWDGFPVNPGHALIIPRRHIASWFDATAEEQAEMLAMVSRMREAIEAEHAPAGYNIGVNVGWAGGQTVDHLHLHVIPRYDGDVEDPRGGIRWVIPQRASYWDDE